mmetsp:Transcript_105332/g.298142  ORF Transcript_105332/g.298142 Transcript_105332/m.298142 type:complete len:283 (-) Transcript_105332:1404-2252(-)
MSAVSARARAWRTVMLEDRAGAWLTLSDRAARRTLRLADRVASRRGQLEELKSASALLPSRVLRMDVRRLRRLVLDPIFDSEFNARCRRVSSSSSSRRRSSNFLLMRLWASLSIPESFSSISMKRSTMAWESAISSVAPPVTLFRMRPGAGRAERPTLPVSVHAGDSQDLPTDGRAHAAGAVGSPSTLPCSYSPPSPPPRCAEEELDPLRMVPACECLRRESLPLLTARFAGTLETPSTVDRRATGTASFEDELAGTSMHDWLHEQFVPSEPFESFDMVRLL